MNLFFGIGKILTDINYGFLMDSKLFAAASALLEISEYYNSINTITIRIKGFNSIADKMYRKLNKDTSIFLKGRLLDNNFIEILDFKIL